MHGKTFNVIVAQLRDVKIHERIGNIAFLTSWCFVKRRMYIGTKVVP